MDEIGSSLTLIISQCLTTTMSKLPTLHCIPVCKKGNKNDSHSTVYIITELMDRITQDGDSHNILFNMYI